ncbi:MAG: hypothetical protein KDC16_12260, partial [Saprospiraceae bacterium]|nr:hypothetical protein [Saprospiraceae bacterium]
MKRLLISIWFLLFTMYRGESQPYTVQQAGILQNPIGCDDGLYNCQSYQLGTLFTQCDELISFLWIDNFTQSYSFKLKWKLYLGGNLIDECSYPADYATVGIGGCYWFCCGVNAQNIGDYNIKFYDENQSGVETFLTESFFSITNCCITINGGTTIEVTNTNDSGPGSLRNAIECANADPVLDIINVTTSGTLVLQSVLPNITDNDISINGNNLNIDGSLINSGDPEIAIYSDGVNIHDFEFFQTHIQIHGNTCHIYDNIHDGDGIQFLGSANTVDNCEIFGALNGVQCQFNNNNIIAFNDIHDCTRGVRINSGSNNNSINNNSIYCNSEIGISVDGNNGIQSPIINTFSSDNISGTAPVNSNIELYINDDTGCSGVPCQGKTYLSTVTADASGNWSWNPSGMVNVGDLITATATDPSGNTSEFSECATVTQPCPTDFANITGNLVLCEGESTTLTASGGVTYLWNTGSSSNVITVSPTTSTSYTVTVTDSNGCTATDAVTVTVNILPNANITGNLVLCEGE